jgi:hypothetical protein
MLALAGVASVLGWSYMRGKARWVSLWGLCLVVLASLVGAAACQAAAATDVGDQPISVKEAQERWRAGFSAASDVLNVAALVLALAGLAAGPQLWEDQMRAAGESRRKRVSRFEPRDVLSWRVWGEIVRGIGAERSALLWLALFVAAWGANVAAAWATRPPDDRAYLLAALAAPAAFGILSTFWMYRGVKRVF